MKPVILFDLGGTLISYYERSEFPGILVEAIGMVEFFLRNEGFPIPDGTTLLERAEAENFEAADCRVRPLEERLSRIFGLDRPSTVPLIGVACRRFMRPIFERSCRYDDSLPTLQRLHAKGIRTAIVSNTAWGSPAELWREELVRFGLDQWIEDAIFCRDAGWRKPDTRVFEYTLQRLGESPKNCLFVGDDPRWDLAGPKTVGMDAVLIVRGGGAPGGDGVVSIQRLEELLDL